MFQSRKYGWPLIGLGVILVGGAARAAADDQGAAPSKADESKADEKTNEQNADEKPAAEMEQPASDDAHCKDVGVTVTFGVGSTEINGRGQSSLKGVAKWAKDEDGRSIRVDGYADQSGPAALNQQLSDERADAVKTYLVGLGVDPQEVDATGHGEHADRPDLHNTRAVAVTTCQAETQAATDHSPEPPAPAPEAEETPPPEPQAQLQPQPVVVRPVTPTHVEIVNVTAPPPRKDLPPSVIGVGFTLGGGAIGFVDRGSRSFVDTGGSWDARLVLGTRLPIAFEGAYVGSAQGIQALGLQNNALLIGNGVEGAARINFSTSRIQPYIFGGAGWMNYQIRNTQIVTSDLQQSDNALTIPFGLGVQARLGRGFLMDVRGTGRVAFDDSLLKQLAASNNAGSASLNSWNTSAHLGWEF